MKITRRGLIAAAAAACPCFRLLPLHRGRGPARSHRHYRRHDDQLVADAISTKRFRGRNPASGCARSPSNF